MNASSAPLKPFRFGIALFPTGGRQAWLEKVRRAEALGYDLICMPDLPHVRPPITVLAAAAAVTERIRLGPVVFNPFPWPPELLTRELAALDQMSGGRIEVGLGTGGWQFGDAVVVPGARAAHLQRVIDLIEAAAEGRPPTAYFVEKKKYAMRSADLLCDFVQRPVPLHIAGFGPRLIEMAARHAHIYGLHAQRRPKEDGLKHSLGILDRESARVQANAFRQAAGPRADTVELSLGPYIAITEDRRRFTEALQPVQAPHLTVDEILDSPKAGIGTVEDIVEHFDQSRREIGISHLLIAEKDMEAFLPIMERLRAR